MFVKKHMKARPLWTLMRQQLKHGQAQSLPNLTVKSPRPADDSSAEGSVRMGSAHPSSSGGRPEVGSVAINHQESGRLLRPTLRIEASMR